MITYPYKEDHDEEAEKEAFEKEFEKNFEGQKVENSEDDKPKRNL